MHLRTSKTIRKEIKNCILDHCTNISFPNFQMTLNLLYNMKLKLERKSSKKNDTLNFEKKNVSKYEGLIIVLVVQSTSSSCRGSEFGFQNSHQVSHNCL